MNHRLIVFFAFAACLGACSPVQERWMSKTHASVSNNQMMLVRDDAGSFGYQRLMAKAEVFPDLAIFLDDSGLPDFFAETSSGKRQYLIFYYLEKRQAYACRSKGAQTTEVEFSGPYTITPREYQLLNGAKREALAKTEGAPV